MIHDKVSDDTQEKELGHAWQKKTSGVVWKANI